MNANSYEVQWWQATSQVNEEVSKQLYVASLHHHIVSQM